MSRAMGTGRADNCAVGQARPPGWRHPRSRLRPRPAACAPSVALRSHCGRTVGFRFERPYQPAEQPPPWVGTAAGLYDDGGWPALAPGQAPEPEPAGAYAERRAVLETATAAARGRLDAARAV